MFTNCPCLTIYEKAVVNRAPAYVRHVTGAVYWQPFIGQTDGKERTPDAKIFVNIPAASTDYLPKRDDRVVKGECADTAPPNDAYTVMGVRDLRYGSPKVQHIELDLG